MYFINTLEHLLLISDFIAISYKHNLKPNILLLLKNIFSNQIYY